MIEQTGSNRITPAVVRITVLGTGGKEMAKKDPSKGKWDIGKIVLTVLKAVLLAVFWPFLWIKLAVSRSNDIHKNHQLE